MINPIDFPETIFHFPILLSITQIILITSLNTIFLYALRSKISQLFESGKIIKGVFVKVNNYTNNNKIIISLAILNRGEQRLSKILFKDVSFFYKYGFFMPFLIY